MNDAIDAIVDCTLAAALCVFVAAVAIGIMAFAGTYHYDYRCHSGITERHLYAGAIPVGGWESISGQTICPR